MLGGDLVLSISFGLDGDCSTECELEVDCKKGVGFKQTKLLEKSSIYQQTVLFLESVTRLSYDILLRNL